MSRRPLPLLTTVAVVALEAVALVLVAVLALANLGGAAGLGVSSAVFFLLCAAALAGCAWGLARLGSWARAPIVLTELVGLGLAWDARHTDTPLAVGLAVLVVVGLAGLFHPATTRALTPEE